MDNYQQSLFNRGKVTFISEGGEEKVEAGDTIVLYQNENYHLGGYFVQIQNECIEQINAKQNIYKPNQQGLISIPVEFKESSFDLVVKFKNGVVDDATVRVKLNVSDNKAYDLKVAKANKETLVSNVALKVTNGVDLINIMWHNASSNVSKTIAKVYCLKDNESYLVVSLETQGEYLKVDSLAFGQYNIVVEQYDSKNNLVISASASILLKDFVETLSEKLDGIKGQVRASGNNVVSW